MVPVSVCVYMDASVCVCEHKLGSVTTNPGYTIVLLHDLEPVISLP